MCSALGCTFCAFMSAFGTFFMFFIGICIKSGYEFVGEWYTPVRDHETDEPLQGSPTQEQTDKAAQSCFAVGGIYLGFTLLAIALTCYYNRRARRANASAH
mmetsp:Transcript_12963/g.22883  ORF Transcript_12963/g.22883 Transcript_12963/m.22883 type:complete len:101 (+) Transcript_12963:107-409(+)